MTPLKDDPAAQKIAAHLRAGALYYAAHEETRDALNRLASELETRGELPLFAGDVPTAPTHQRIAAYMRLESERYIAPTARYACAYIAKRLPT